MKEKRHTIFLAIIFLIFLLTLIFSYNGFFFFTKGINIIDQLFINIFSDVFLVGIVTYISTKSASTYVAEKEFKRNNKINIAVYKSKNKIDNYKMFMKYSEDENVFFITKKADQKVIEQAYEYYNYLLNIFECQGLEKQIIDIVLNIPFIYKLSDDKNIKESFDGVLKSLKKVKKLTNVRVFKSTLKREQIDNLKKLSNIVLNMNHYHITNLNNIEGCHIELKLNNKLLCDIPCLPNSSYDVYLYFRKKEIIDIKAYTYDFNSKKYCEEITQIIL